MKKILALALVLCMVFALSVTAYADFEPNGPVTMIVSYKAGSGTDNTARILAKYAEKYVGQTIVIENVEGGSGSIGWSQLADADPDGQTIGFINLPNFSSSIVNEMGTYTVDSFAPICNSSFLVFNQIASRMKQIIGSSGFAKFGNTNYN